MEIKTENVTIPVKGVDQPMGAYVAAPAEAGPHPAVIVIQEIFGVNAHIREVTDRIAREGYVAIAPDVHHRVAPGRELGYTPADMQTGMQVIGKLSLDGFTADLDATLAAVRARADVRGDRIGAIGFCIGGHLAYLAAALRADVRATASFYGGGIATFGPGGGPRTVERTRDIKGRILCLFGGQDQMIPPEQVDEIKRALVEGDVRHEVVVYPQTGHAFFCDKAERGSYNAEAAEDAWRRVKELFGEELRAA
jgi:carboxymethylenebutenolidase